MTDEAKRAGSALASPYFPQGAIGLAARLELVRVAARVFRPEPLHIAESVCCMLSSCLRAAVSGSWQRREERRCGSLGESGE